MKTKDRRQKKVARKTDHRGFELGVVKTEFSLDRKASAGKASGQGIIYFEGYASIFDTSDSYNDIILPGAFKDTLKQKGPKKDADTGEIYGDIISLWQHNPDWPFGMPQHFEEDSTGLYHRTMISNTTENMDRVQYMEDRVVKGESIGFRTTDFEWADEEEDEDSFWPLRYIKAVDLWEISPVTFPAHSDAITMLIQRNRELALAVKQVDHGGILAMAHRLKGITAPAVEEAIAVLDTVKDVLCAQAEDERDEGEDGEGEGEDGLADSSSEREEQEEQEGREGQESVDTSADDPELVKGLEAFAFELEAATVMASMQKGRFS